MTTAHKPTLTFSIEGSGVTPESVRVRDLYEVLSLVESALAETSKTMVGVSKTADLSLSLVKVEGGSNLLSVAMSRTMFQAADVVVSAVAEEDFSAVPMVAQAQLRKLWQKANRQSWDFRFSKSDGRQKEAQISSKREILKPAKVSGVTTLYGKCVDVGGDTKITVRLRLESGDYFTAQVNNLEMGRELGGRLQEWVGLEGEAKWDSETWSMQSFRATRITEYHDTNPVEAFSKLAATSGNAWDDVDAEEFVRELRAE